MGTFYSLHSNKNHLVTQFHSLTHAQHCMTKANKIDIGDQTNEK